MPTITLNKKIFESLVGRKLPLEQLKERISMLGTDLEKIEGDEIHVEIFPNRPDMLSEQGFARAFSSFIGAKTGLRKYGVSKSGQKLFVKNTPVEWPYAIAFIARGLTLDEEKVRELIQLQEKLGVTMLRNRKKGGIGLYPLQKLHFPITFEGRKPEQISFRPLEYPSVISAKQILTEHKKGKEYGHLMEKWEKYAVFVDNKGNIMSMPPIINSHELGKVEETTKDLFVECTGKDLPTITKAINIVAASLADMGAKIESIEVNHNGQKWDVPNLAPSVMKLDLAYINKRLGLDLTEKKAKELLECMSFGYVKNKVLVPAYRADILHQADIAEDIAIAYGYENFEEIIPNVATIAQEDHFEVFARKIRELLIGLRLVEVKNYHLITLESLNQKMNLENRGILLKNSVGEFNTLRDWIIPSIMKTLADNLHNEYPQNIFEIGKVFSVSNKTDTGYGEEEHLAIALCHEKADFTEIRQTVDTLTSLLGLSIEIKETKHPSFIPGRVGEILIDKKKVGLLGELHPQVLVQWGLLAPVVVAELNMEELMKRVSG